MNKIAKASIAGAAGVILLMGGAGSLAYWNNSANLGATSTTVTSGQLKVVANADGAWSNTFNGTTAAGLPTNVVPGDTLNYSQSFAVTAIGDHLKFRVATTTPSYTGTLQAALVLGTLTVTAYDGSSTPLVVTPDANGTYTVSQNVKTLKVAVPFSWNFSNAPTSDNTYQNTTATIGATAGTVTITQVQS